MEKRVKWVLLALLIASLTKALILGIGLNETILTTVLAGFIAFYDTKSNNEQIIKLQSQISQLQLNEESQKKTIDDVKNSMVSLKVSSGIRGLGGVNR